MKVAVVGIRAMGQSHVKAARRSPVVTETAGCDLDAEVRKSVGTSLGIPTYADVPTLLSQFTPDAVVVATAPNRHAEVARACFERGIAVLTEKPICSTLEESTALVRLAAEKGIPFQCGFQLRYCGVMRAIASLLEGGALGRLSHIGLTQRSGPHMHPGYMTRARTGGIFFEKLCHQVDLFRFLLGEPQRAIAIAAPNVLDHYEVHDNVMSVFEFAGGAKGTISFDTRRAAQVDATSTPERTFEGREAGHFYELVFSGDLGTATYDPWTETIDVVRYNHRPDLLTQLVRRIRVREEFGEPAYDIATQDGDFFARVGAGLPPRHPAADALVSMVWTQKAEESLRLGGAWVR